MREEPKDNQGKSKGTEFLRGTASYEFMHPPVSFKKVYRDDIDKEIAVFGSDHQKQHGGSPGTKRVEAFRREVEKKYADRHHQNEIRVLLWERSERLLDALRTKGMVPSDDQALRNENLATFVRTVDVKRFPEIHPDCSLYMGEKSSEKPTESSPNLYFESTQPRLVGLYGLPFFTAIGTETTPSTNHYEPAITMQTERILGLNALFWAGLLGGDRRLQHDVIYYLPEEQFYYFDLPIGCYVPTSEAKLTLGLSLLLQQCAYGQTMDRAKMILEKCRTNVAYKEVIAHAKTILAADAGFFTGPDAKPRWRPKHESAPENTPDPVALKFVEDQIEPADGPILPVRAVLERFRQDSGQSVPSDRVLREQIEQAVNAVYSRTPRNDLRQPNGSCVASWKGLKLRVSPDVPEHFDIADLLCPSSGGSGASEASGQEEELTTATVSVPELVPSN